MSPRQNKEKRDVHDSTTEFFLKVVQKEKEAASKESTTKENISATKTKTIDTCLLYTSPSPRDCS